MSHINSVSIGQDLETFVEIRCNYIHVQHSENGWPDLQPLANTIKPFSTSIHIQFQLQEL